MSPRTPDFYCIGSQKSATTWLYRCMETHPQVHCSPFKEVHYFDSLYVGFHKRIHRARARLAREHFAKVEQSLPSPLLRGARRLLLGPKQRRKERRLRWWLEQEHKQLDDAWYAQVFKNAQPGQLVFDVTPAYAVLPREGIEHLQRLSPQAKVLIILRDPVERSFSHAKMLIRKAHGEMSDERLFEMATSRLVASRDRYCEILDLWQANFPPERFMVAFYEEVQQRPLDFLHRLCDFLGIEYRSRYFPVARKVVYRGPSVEMSRALRERLASHHQAEIQALQARFPEQTRGWGARPSAD